MGNINKNKAIWISHRGYKGSNVENTFGSFDSAIALGFTSLETDLRLTSDEELVLCHDPDLQRLVGEEKTIDSFSREELSCLVLKDGSSFVFFDQFVEKYKGYTWTLDIKPQNGLRTILALAKWATASKANEWLENNARFLMWRGDQERLLKELFPNARFYARKPECWRAGLSVIAKLPVFAGIKPGRTYAISSHVAGISLFRPEIVKIYHDRGARVVAYLPNTEDDARQAVEAGYDEVLTNGKRIL